MNGKSSAGNRRDRATAKQLKLSVAQVQQIHLARGTTNESLRAAPESAIRRALRRLDYPDQPRAREAFRQLTERDERGRIRSDALAHAVRELDSMRARVAQRPRVAGMPTGRGVQPSALLPALAGLGPAGGPGPALAGWTALGPGNIGGRTRSIIVHPTNPNTMWAGSVGGGIWRTNDGGASWEPVDDLMANLAVTCMVMDPTNSNVIYAGTGEGFSNIDSLRGAGIFRTSDGTTWSQLPGTVGADFHLVNRLAISKTGNVLLAATPRGLFRSSDAAFATWTRVLADPMADVDFSPADSQKAIAGGLGTGKAYYSLDGGRTWREATHSGVWGGRVEVTYAAKNPATVYASVQGSTGEIWRSTNGGKSYVRRRSRLADGTDSMYLGEQGWYDNVIWAGDPTDSNLVLVGGIDLWRSTDGGNTLVDISTWWDRRSAHADHHCILSHPDYDGVNNRAVFFGNDGGIYKAENVRTVGQDADPPRVSGWTELVNTYSVTQFYSGAGNPTSGTIIGGAQDNGTLRYTSANGTEGWTEMFGGDGGWCAADPTDPDVFYGEYVFLNIHRSTDGGATAEFISGQFWNGFEWTWKPIPFRIPDARNNDALFIAPFVLDPNEPDRILGGGRSLWRTNDAKTPNTNDDGPAWARIKDSAGEHISAIAVAKGNSNIIWVGYVDGQVHKTTNGTASAPVWQRIDNVGPQALSVGRYCTRIAIDPRDSDVVYVTFGGYSRGNIWKTTDGGATWSNIGNALPEAPVRSVTIHPRKEDFIYIGTEVGVFASEDGGANWSPTNEGPTNCSVDDLFWMGQTLVCATHGRGMFHIDLSGV